MHFPTTAALSQSFSQSVSQSGNCRVLIWPYVSLACTVQSQTHALVKTTNGTERAPPPHKDRPPKRNNNINCVSWVSRWKSWPMAVSSAGYQQQANAETAHHTKITAPENNINWWAQNKPNEPKRANRTTSTPVYSVYLYVSNDFLVVRFS